ncbi:MAG: class I SAM-dependent methyltransferase [Candidatus Wukongarchaeota archaeon]|nr:class I SAM-dependent methyltransferase [Candidatus Wukongarchaeota archaeon]
MFWDNQYENNGRIWGEGPSELAITTVRYLQKLELNHQTLTLLDIGCGYGRDTFYFLNNLKCKILAIDISEKALDIASNAIPQSQKEDVKFQHCNFTELKKGKYDIVFISNLYQLLKKNERKELRKAVMRTLKPNGLLFLSTLSVKDPEHYGKGTPIPEEPNSFQDRVYLHFCTKEELIEDFAFLKIKKLYEHEYYEPRTKGETHHHISWILIGEYIGTSNNTA